MIAPLPDLLIDPVVRAALAEDLGRAGDITALACIDADARLEATFGARKLKSDAANEASDERVVEVVVSADHTPFLIGQRVLARFMKPGEHAGAKHTSLSPSTPTPGPAP